MGGLSRGILDARHGYDFWDGSFYDEYTVKKESLVNGEYKRIASIYDKSEKAVITDHYLQIRLYDTYGIQKGDFNINVITTRAAPYGLTESGEYVNLTTGNIVKGYVSGNSAVPGVEYHISPFVTTNSNANVFQATAGHELIHAYHRYVLGVAYQSMFSEMVAYRYSYSVYSNAKMTKNAYVEALTALFHNYWGYCYPKSYKIPSPYLFY